MSIDHTTHSLFGVSKTSADLLTQEYSHYFGLKTAVFRGGCLTGPMHSPAELHGFLAYLVKCIVNEIPYTIFGYKGKQVRDNIHSKDLIQMFIEFHNNPKNSAVYNAGGGRNNSISILEAIEKISIVAKKTPIIKVNEENRIGDHQWYITNNSKFQKDYPTWNITYSLENLIDEMVFTAKK
jgi:CDP-paratose 2-epimerase